MKGSRRRKWIITVIVALLLAVGGYFGWQKWGSSKAPTASAQSLSNRTVRVERGDVVQTLTVYGTIAPKQEYTYTFSADKVSEILVKEGERVEKGQVIVKLDNKQEELALLQAQDALNTAKAEGAAATIKERQLAYEIAQAKYDATTLRAPFAGVVAQVKQATGSSDQDQIKLINTEELYIDASVDQLDVPGVAVGQQAVATIEAFPNKKWPVKITSIGGVAVKSGNTAMVTVTAKLPTPNPDILVGFSAELEITTAQARNVLRVPISSLVQMPRGWTVIKVVGGKATPQRVEIGVTSDQYAEVKSGLAEGDEILLYPKEAGTSQRTTATQKTTGIKGTFNKPVFPKLP